MSIELYPHTDSLVEELRADLIKAIKANEVRLGWLDEISRFGKDFLEVLADTTNWGSVDFETLKNVKTSLSSSFVKTLKVEEGLVALYGVAPSLVLFVRQDSLTVKAIKFMKSPGGKWAPFPFMTFTEKGVEMGSGTDALSSDPNAQTYITTVVFATLQTLADRLHVRH